MTEIYRNGRLTGESVGGFAVGTGVSYSEKDYVAKVKTTIGEVTGINVNGVRADLTDINRDVNNRVDVMRDREVTPIDVDLGTEYWATDYARERMNKVVTEVSKKYNMENIKNELTYLNIKRIQKKVERGEELSEKEKELYSFVDEVVKLYFSEVEENKLEIKKSIDIEEVNNNLTEKEKLYTVDSNGEKNLNYENINKFLTKYVEENTVLDYDINGQLRKFPKDKKSADTIAIIYTLVYEEKIEKNDEYQKFQNEWIMRSISSIHNNKNLRHELEYSKITANSFDKMTSDEVIANVYRHIKESTEKVLDDKLYKNYGNQVFFAMPYDLSKPVGNQNKLISDEKGRWIFPELIIDKEIGSSYAAVYVPNYNNIRIKVFMNREGVLFHEINHGIQVFFASNYEQFSNKGYNDKLVDVGRWFKLNDIHIAYSHYNRDISIYNYNIREYDSAAVHPVRGGAGKYSKIHAEVNEK